MLYALTSAYSRKDYDNQQQGLPMQTNIGKLFSIFAWGLDIVQENAELVKLWDDLDQAKGAVLDRYGANWGVKRFSENDALYRLAIRVKIMSQLSGGDTDTVIKAAAELLGVEDPDIEFEDVFPAKIALYVDWMLLTQERQDLIEPIALAIKRIVAAGVGMRLYVRTYRTYRYDLPVSHGGAIGRFYRHQPVGEDRDGIWDVPVARGGTVVTEFAYEPIGEDRTGRVDLGIGRVARQQSDLDLPMIGEDRTARVSMGIGRAAHQRSGLDPPVMGKDRTARVSMGIGHAVRQQSDFSTPLIGEGKAFQVSVPVAHSGLLPPTVTGAMPDSKVSGTMQRDSKGGAYMHSHIKPKRID